MNCLRYRNYFAIFCAVLICGSHGCRSEVPTQVNPPAQSDSSTSSMDPIVAAPDNSDTPFELETGFSPLTRTDFEEFDDGPDTWKATGDGIVCTGKPKGYLYSKQSYDNFTWRLEYRFPRPASLKDETKFKGNTGFLVYINGEQKLWPICLEVQGKQIQMAAIKENGGADPVTTDDNEPARQQARKPVGQWNAIEIVSKAGALTVSLNGTPISTSQAGTLTSGLIGIQAEDHPFEIRRMRIHTE